MRDGHGAFLAWAGYSPKSQIAARAWSFDERDQIDAAFFRRRLEEALAYRRMLASWQRAESGSASAQWKMPGGDRVY